MSFVELNPPDPASGPGVSSQPRSAERVAERSAARVAERSVAVRAGFGVGIAVGLSGVAFGAAAVSAGMSVAQTCALSLLAFSGASQFALVGVVAGGGNLIAGALGAVLLGGRNALYGLRLADLLNVRGPRRFVTAHVVIDETTAVATAQPTPEAARAGFRTTALVLFLMWNLTTFLGAVGAHQIGHPATFGLDVVGPAAFLALLWPRLTAGGTERLVALTAAATALVATPFLPVGIPIMLAATATLLGSSASRKSGPVTPEILDAGEGPPPYPAGTEVRP
jgi:predicted branched-subunit amino acid permease